MPIVLAVELFGHMLKNKCVIIRSDNIAVVDILNKQTSKDNQTSQKIYVEQYTF